MNITERFLNYVKFDTQSAEESQTVPSTSKQLIFAEYLRDELKAEGFADVEMDEQGYIYATLKANTKKEIPTIGFISHYDTSPDCSGKDVKPRIVKEYDGGDLGDLEYENFNAAAAKININGVSVHPGFAKGKMVNASMLATELAGMMPADERPETTEGYEGFYHLLGIESNTEHAKMSYIIRDHDRKKFEDRKKFIVSVVDKMNEKYGEGTVEIAVNDQYYNMKEKIDPNMHVIDIVLKAMELCGVPPKVQPIRGGTDGAQLSFKGLPCPNIFTGGVNFHGPYEFVSIQVMEKAMQTVVKICELTAGYND